MYKNSTLIFNRYLNYVKSPYIKNKQTTIDRQQKFIRDKLNDTLSPATKEYLKLQREIKNEMKK
jgi:hypothetical protein